jgi:predicted DsbA family dithiol-disulfide isomerase
VTDSITVYSDYVCPFCYLGRESLARYQDERETALEIDWHPFDLRAGRRGPDGNIDPEADDGKGEDYYAEARENVERLAGEYDVEMAQHIATDVDSRPTQIASYRVRETEPYERWLAFDTGLFEALWRDGRDVGDVEVLADVGADAGIDPDVVRDAVADEEAQARVDDLFSAATQQGVTGVPTFVYEGHAARGAVPPSQLRRLVEGV